MRIKKKRIVIVLTVLLALLVLNVGIAGRPEMAGGCVCVSFDRRDMLRADKIVIEFRGKTHTVTDRNFILGFTQAAMAGTYSDYCCANLQEGRIEIYRGDRLIRSMRYVENHDAVVYDEDAARWVLGGEEGHVFLTGWVKDELRRLLGMRGWSE